MVESERQQTRAAEFEVSSDPATTFALLEPIGERRWAPEWDPQFVYPESCAPQTGAVFTYGNGDRTSFWTIADYNRERRHIVYVMFLPGERLTRIEIDCSASGAGGTRVRVAYTHTALGDAGRALLAGFTEAAYRRELDGWQAAIESCLAL